MTGTISGVRVLCVAASMMTRAALETLLRDWQIQVDGVADGASALERLCTACQEGHLYDLAILDHQLDDIDSIALARIIRGERSNKNQ